MTEEEYAKYAGPEVPERGRDHPAAGELRRPLLHLLAAPAARRPLRRRRGVRRRPADHLDPRPRPPARRSRRSSRAASAAIEPTASVVVLDNDTAAVRAMVGGLELPGGAVQPRHQRAPPARLLVQAVHPDHRARAGSLDRRGLHLGAPGDPVPGPVRGESGEEKTVNELFEVSNYEDSYLGSASLATATTYSDNSVYSQLGTAGRPRERRRDGGEDGDRDRPLDRRRVLDRRPRRSRPTTRR